MIDTKISDNLKELYAKRIRNPIKKQLFLKYINSENLKMKYYETRIEAFRRIWSIAMTITRSKYGFGNRTGKTLSKLASQLFEEDIFYKKSLVNLYETTVGKSIKSRITEAEILEYFERTKEFFKKYGDENSTVAGKTLNDLLDDYREHKITKEQLNKYIKDFQKSNPEYNPSLYKKYNSASRDSKSDFFD